MFPQAHLTAGHKLITSPQLQGEVIKSLLVIRISGPYNPQIVGLQLFHLGTDSLADTLRWTIQFGT